MVRENRVFRTQAQKVSYEDILRALRVSSFFRLRCSLILINVYHDLLEKSRGESLMNSISCSYAGLAYFHVLASIHM